MLFDGLLLMIICGFAYFISIRIFLPTSRKTIAMPVVVAVDAVAVVDLGAVAAAAAADNLISTWVFPNTLKYLTSAKPPDIKELGNIHIPPDHIISIPNLAR